MHKNEALVSVPGFALRIVPAGITNSPPSTTNTLPEIVHTLSAERITLDDISPLSIKFSGALSSIPKSSLSLAISQATKRIAKDIML